MSRCTSSPSTTISTARDAECDAPGIRSLGLTVGVDHPRQDPAARRAQAYGCDVTYCTNKELTFDYLRDRMALGRRTAACSSTIERLSRQGAARTRLVLRGLFYAIVDEADSVLIDEARTPLIISGAGPVRPGARDVSRPRSRWRGALGRRE